MTELAVAGIRAERDAMLEVLVSLDDEEWRAVRDVVSHVASTHHRVVEPQLGDWPVEDPLAEFEQYTARSSAVFAAMQQAPRAERSIDMGTFGTHPSDRLADLYLFDMYGHLRADILAPYGPVERQEPPRDEMRVRPTVEWMLAALPWINPDALNAVVELALDGPGGGTWTITPDGVHEGGSSDAVARVRSGDHEFTIWGSGRRAWREYAAIDGDEAAAARVLDAINII